MIRRLLRIAAGGIGAVGALVMAYLIAAWIGSSLPQNSAWTEPADGVEIMVETNGTHTGIILPIVTPAHDWREVFPSAALPRSDGQMPTHIALGWGEREVFLNVPTWGDLSVATALRIAFTGGEPIMRVSHYVRPTSGENHRPLRISHAQYAALAAAIEQDLPQMAASEREILKGTYAPDAYYEALGSYSLAATCNSWVGETLAEAGIPMGRWTPLAGGVMKWIPRPD